MISREDTIAVFIDFQERLMPVMNRKKELEEKVIRLAEGLKVLGIPNIVTQQYTKGIGETVSSIAEAIGSFEHIEKTSFSCMNNVDFVNKLELEEKENVIVCGIEAHICVQQTVLAMLEENYNVVVPIDCCSSRSLNDYLWATERMGNAGAIITTYEAVLFELLKDSKSEGFKEISKIVK